MRLTSRPLFHDWKAQNRETNANFEAFRGHFSWFSFEFPSSLLRFQARPKGLRCRPVDSDASSDELEPMPRLPPRLHSKSAISDDSEEPQTSFSKRVCC